MDRLTNQQKSIFRSYIKTICDQTLLTADELRKEQGYWSSNEAFKIVIEDYVDNQLGGELECSYTLHAVTEYIYNEGVNWIPDYLQDVH